MMLQELDDPEKTSQGQTL